MSPSTTHASTVPAHKKYRTAHRLSSVRSSLLTALLMIGGSLGAGVLGYHFLGSLSWIDALLEAAMILGGEGPIAPMHNDAVKLFAAMYALFSGLAVVGTTGILLAPWIHTIMYHTHRQAHRDAVAEDDKKKMSQ